MFSQNLLSQDNTSISISTNIDINMHHDFTNVSSTPHNTPTHSCGICYENYNNNIIFLPCLHHLCYDCIDKITKPICPYCRHDFSSYNNIQNKHSYDTDDDFLQHDNIDFLVERQLFFIENRQKKRHKHPRKQKKHQKTTTNYPNLYDFHILFN